MKTQYEAMTIALMWGLLGIYIIIGNFLISEPRDEFSIIVRFAESDGVMFCSAVTIVKLIELFRLRLYDPITRLTLLFVIYVAVYGITAGPYMIVSFVQPFHRHVLAHFAILFLILESTTYYLQNRKEK